jgi:hypothetical protein
MPMTRKRTRSKAPTPITGVAAGNLGTAANLDDTQVLKTQDLEPVAPLWLDDDAAVAAPVEEVPSDDRSMLRPVAAPVAPAAGAAPEPLPEQAVAPHRPSPQRPSLRRGEEPLNRRRGLALAGAGALATLLVLAGAGILSQLDLGFRGAGAEATFPAFGVATAPPLAESPEPQASGGRGHGHDSCHGRHCN